MNIENLKNIEEDGQGVINFVDGCVENSTNDAPISEEVRLRERKEAAEKYHVANEESIYKAEDGEWLFVKDNSSVKDWDSLWSNNDNSEMYNR
jgi:hypothetical protein